jgi:hypothetical protein
MRDYIAIFSTKKRAAIAIRFYSFSRQHAQAAAQRYARDFVLHLDEVHPA